jgi:coenzyme F420 hydrogenase subunit beta
MTQGQSPTLKRVLSGQLCSGCGLCAGVAPDAVTMETVAPGYSRPLQTAPVSADAERAIATACPGAKVAPWTGIAPDSHEYWGPWRGIHTSYALDPDVRFAGSSGGAISALLVHALGTGQVEQVLHVTADPEKPTRNIITFSTTAEQVVRNRSEERRVGKECRRLCRSRWSPYH